MLSGGGALRGKRVKGERRQPKGSVQASGWRQGKKFSVQNFSQMKVAYDSEEKGDIETNMMAQWMPVRCPWAKIRCKGWRTRRGKEGSSRGGGGVRKKGSIPRWESLKRIGFQGSEEKGYPGARREVTDKHVAGRGKVKKERQKNV